MLKLMKLVFYRIIHNKAFLITYLVLIPIVIGIAIYFTNSVSFQLRVGVVGDVEVVKNDEVNYVYLDHLPNQSKLVLNEYDALITQKGNELNVQSTKGEEFNQALTFLVTGQIASLQGDETQRGTATNIIGFLMMVVLLLGSQTYQYYFDERNGINRRIMSTPFKNYQYMLGHFSVVFLFLFIPAIVVILATINIFNIVLSIALWQFILVLLLLCFFATAFGQWINAMVRTIEESLLFGNMFAIAGSIVAGGFVQVTNNQIFNSIVQFLPQKQIMSLLESLENHHQFSYIGIVYVIALSIVLILSALVIEKRKLPSR